MEKLSKKVLSFLLTFVFLLLPFTMLKTVTFAKLDGYNVGDTLFFGSYPQEVIEDRDLIYKFLSQDIDWNIKYKYSYNSVSDVSDIRVIKCIEDFSYADFEDNGSKYRLVNEGSGSKYLLFRFTPIEWQILDPESGLVISKQILDYQYYNTDFPQEAVAHSSWQGSEDERSIQFEEQMLISCKYADSDIRNWLNNEFYNTAFSEEEMKQIKETTLNNKKHDRSLSKADSEDTIDNVFLLSFDDMINVNYGFDFSENYADENRRATKSQYATYRDGKFHDTKPSWYVLRGADCADDTVINKSGSSFCFTGGDPGTSRLYPDTYQSNIRPAITIADLKLNDKNSIQGSTTSVNESNPKTSYSNNNHTVPIVIISCSGIAIVIIIVIISRKKNG